MFVGTQVHDVTNTPEVLAGGPDSNTNMCLMIPGSIEPGATFVAECDATLRGSVVSLQRLSNLNTILSLCEVAVYGPIGESKQVEAHEPICLWVGRKR